MILTKATDIGINYQTIAVTQSRINKGLLAIPVALLEQFPTQKDKIHIYFDDEQQAEVKSFLPLNTSAREARIGGLTKWFAQNNLKANDEVVINVIDSTEGVYRISKESRFVQDIRQLEQQLQQHISTIDDTEVINQTLQTYCQKVHLTEKQLLLNQYVRLKDLPVEIRKYKNVATKHRKENVPFLMRKILEACYEGKCQVSGFTFMQKNGKPYFEIHHIDENRGNDWKNLLVVSPNIHAQFTYGHYSNCFDQEGWLRQVDLNGQLYSVKQLLDKLPTQFTKTIYQ